ncbi:MULTISPECIES: hypothetical protein [Tsukamurella]|uniref:Uncharacterized protein n=2 Tax=Tsukamurella TaxID=2060 RepID=A0A5C5RT94_9ACTN|nr:MULTISPECIES: hypothetical protein [Tsukamurella]NMD56998.1 hypothetical protein [Tsukamurella columbiensis]TWS25693.1 hypothetical protein FK530_22470 [Tsukamurella conjunctivitidis]
MITPFQPTLTVASRLFDTVIGIVDRSEADSLIDCWHALERGAGGRPPSGFVYTSRAVLTAILILTFHQRTVTIRQILATIADMTDEQLAAVGMAGANTSAIYDQPKREYTRFHAWLTRQFTPVDPHADLPAQRISNKEHKRLLGDRTAEQWHAAERAGERLSILINRIVAASVWEKRPQGCRGDLVTDESTFDLARHMYGLGVKDDKLRGATPGGSPYARGQDNAVSTGSEPLALNGKITKSGYGLGLTALTRVGEPHQLHAVPPVVIGISVGKVTSGSVEGLFEALTRAKENDLTGRSPSSRAAWPFLTVDMGYNVKRTWAETMIREQYAYVGRYPSHWKTVYPSAPAAGRETDPGPVQVAGDFYCPAVQPHINKFTVRPTRTMLESNPSGFAEHDRALAQVLPLLMGRNSRPEYRNVTRGRPRIGGSRDEQLTVKLVCPAAMGRVRCPLKPESLSVDSSVPAVDPTWSADRYGCCSNASLTVTLTDAQVRLAQWGMTPGSWEHALYYEAARSLTEQRFSQLKSNAVTGLKELVEGPRREPLIAITLAAAVAVLNHRTQEAYDRRQHRAESIDIRMRLLESDLGHPPAKTPPRT